MIQVLPFDEWSEQVLQYLKCHPLIKLYKRQQKKSFWLARWKQGYTVNMMIRILVCGSRPGNIYSNRKKI